MNPLFSLRSPAYAALLLCAPLFTVHAVTDLGKVMPLGDSITDGVGGQGGSGGGYRAPLYTDLTGAGYTVLYVGSATDNPGPLPANEQHHEGHPGYRVDQIISNLTGGGDWVAANPNSILLHIGTNDILQHYDTVGGETEAQFMTDLEDRMHTLVQDLVNDLPSAQLYIASLIPINNADNAEVKLYNAYIQNTLVPQYATHASFVDQYHNFVNGDGSVNGALLPDAVHPNGAGYSLMAGTWATALEAVPEPSTGAAAAAAVVFAGARKRRVRRTE